MHPTPVTPAELPAVLPAAVLFDMDGTLIDSEPFWIAAETDLVTAHGGTWSHADGMALVGRPMRYSAGVLQARGVDLGVEEIVAELNARMAAAVAARTPWQPGALELVRAVRAAGVPTALVTSSFRTLADPFAAATGLFDVVVAGDDVEHPKPDPEPYLRGADLLGVDVTACVALEDSPSGIASALASGARTLAVEAVVPVQEQPGLSVVRSLVDVDLAVLARVAAGEVLRRADAA
ncbi:HAD family hydrolase [Cellulomonas marina]|uniref:Haloacid dehalogenase superfamily, subfamily IA, variant 3 with third motif having DD or ED n=1 Tax=Cellulomonas marina TaxID=988821 RepID=A0A1I0ZQ75_9CELL|nr:HAD family phosphatase [Cellulomonas marina]GIG28850.1 haloacid dehalogenase [Cellulomonas marina]SFB27651.1 haloacid dehalogenase superfamily, subfamily IA, variant 3 with third motif having DD or ED [Cellulomonas marina]